MPVIKPDISFARHETFHLRDGWLAKGVAAVHGDPTALSVAEAHHRLGVGKNMLTAIRYWCHATELLEKQPAPRAKPTLQLSALGASLLAADPYFEDPGTSWILHYKLATNRTDATFWYWVFNEFEGEELAEQDAVSGVQEWAIRTGAEPPNAHSIEKDWSCFARTYVPTEAKEMWDEMQSPLSHLGLVQRSSGGKIRLNIGPKMDLPPLIFAWACRLFADARKEDGAQIFSLDELRWNRCSPGRILGLDIRALSALIDALADRGWATTSRTAGLRNVHFRLPSPAELLRHHFADMR